MCVNQPHTSSVHMYMYTNAQTNCAMTTTYTYELNTSMRVRSSTTSVTTHMKRIEIRDGVRRLVRVDTLTLTPPTHTHSHNATSTNQATSVKSSRQVKLSQQTETNRLLLLQNQNPQQTAHVTSYTDSQILSSINRLETDTRRWCKSNVTENDLMEVWSHASL